MVGEASEWLLDWYFPYIEPCVDCAYLTPNVPPNGSNGAGGRILLPVAAYRGGNFTTPASFLAPDFAEYPLFFSVLFPTEDYYGLNPSYGLATLGARCARSP